MKSYVKAIALGARLSNCRNVLTLGVKPSFSDYTPREASLILSAEKVFYPSTFYADLLDAMGKKTFPSYHTYKFVQDKIRQTSLFHMARIPHPRTGVYYGDRQKRRITGDFAFPFIAKIPRGSARGDGVFRIDDRAGLDAYLEKTRVAYIQEHIDTDRDIRVVIIGKKIAHAYWRVSPSGDFRTNIARGGRVDLAPVPKGALDLALSTAKTFHWDDVGIDLINHEGTWNILEANMRYGREGFEKAGIDYIELMESLVASGQL